MGLANRGRAGSRSHPRVVGPRRSVRSPFLKTDRPGHNLSSANPADRISVAIRSFVWPSPLSCVEKWKKVWNTPSSLCSKGLIATESTRRGGCPCPRPSAGRLGEAAGLVVVTPLDQCLAAYPPSEWSRLEEQLRTAARLQPPGQGADASPHQPGRGLRARRPGADPAARRPAGRGRPRTRGRRHRRPEPVRGLGARALGVLRAPIPSGCSRTSPWTSSGRCHRPLRRSPVRAVVHRKNPSGCDFSP